MTQPNSDSPVPRHSCVSDSPYTTYFYDDGEGDNTVRPIPPERMAQARAERDKIDQALAWRKQQEELAKNPPPPESPDATR